MSAAKGQPAAIVPATTQTPKAIIPAEIKNEDQSSKQKPQALTRCGSPGAKI